MHETNWFGMLLIDCVANTDVCKLVLLVLHQKSSGIIILWLPGLFVRCRHLTPSAQKYLGSLGVTLGSDYVEVAQLKRYTIRNFTLHYFKQN